MKNLYILLIILMSCVYAQDKKVVKSEDGKTYVDFGEVYFLKVSLKGQEKTYAENVLKAEAFKKYLDKEELKIKNTSPQSTNSRNMTVGDVFDKMYIAKDKERLAKNKLLYKELLEHNNKLKRDIDALKIQIQEIEDKKTSKNVFTSPSN